MRFVAALSLVSLTFAAVAVAEAPQEKDVTVLYAGGDLTGWVGREDLWSVEDGAIVGRTVADNPLKANSFLIWQGSQPENFELTAQFKIEGGNSGIQYRSKVLDKEKFVVGGYQADIDFSNRFAGILYEEKGRGILAERGQSVTIDADGEKIKKNFGDAEKMAEGIHPGKWNDFRVVADGNKLQHFINETMTAEVIDDQPSKSSAKGVIALQIHQGPPMVIRFKNIKVRKLK